MSESNSENLEERFEAGESILDYFETDVILTADRLADLAPILNLSAVAREAGIKVRTLQSKIRRRAPLTGEETRQIVRVLRRQTSLLAALTRILRNRDEKRNHDVRSDGRRVDE